MTAVKTDDDINKKANQESTIPKFNRPDFQNLGTNKFRSVFKATGRFQSINRSRR